MAVRKELLDFLKTLKIEAWETDKVFAIKAPTWEINEKVELDNFMDDFEVDEVGALRDYASVPSHALTPFFPDAELLSRNARTGGTLPVDTNTLILAPSFKPKIMFTYFVGLDLSVRGDSTGVAMCHYDRYQEKVELDFAFGVKAEFRQRLDYGIIRNFIYRLSDRGFNIKQILYDQYQSSDSINILRQKGYNAQEVKYSESFVGNTTVHELILTNKLLYDDFNTQFIGEAKELQIVNDKRIDHLKTDGYWNSKDAWDAAVNCIIRCLDDYYAHGDEELEAEKNVAIMDRLMEEKREHDENDLDWLL